MNKITIELGGKERTLKFNMLFLEEYQRNYKDSLNGISATAIMIWSGLKAYAEVTDTPVDCSKEDCYDWAEEMLLNNDVDTINKISEAYMQSNIYKATEEAK